MFSYIKYFCLFVCACVCVRVHVDEHTISTMHVWRSENSLGELVLPLHSLSTCESGIELRASDLAASLCPHPPSQLTVSPPSPPFGYRSGGSSEQ